MLNQMKAASTLRSFSAGTVILEEGNTDNHNMYIVLAGEVAVYKNYGLHGECVLATLGAGTFFGEMSLFLNEPRNATVVAIETTVSLEINKNNVENILLSNPDFAIRIVEEKNKRTLANKMITDELYKSKFWENMSFDENVDEK